jgi:hypothetical protein
VKGGDFVGWKLEKIELSGCNQIKPNEEIDLTIVLEEEKQAVIHGTVKFPNGKPVKNAAVKLFKKKYSKDRPDFCELIPITFAFTDECGNFLFGVESRVDYVIKVFYYKPEKPDLPRDEFKIIDSIE